MKTRWPKPRAKRNNVRVALKKYANTGDVNKLSLVVGLLRAC